ncbi:L,D-transpeptidase family protein [Desertimonas flava]|uniref:L,D-transpeptidase family protein n=1 Tax=Desertimonas flava TaxID=2064846 RepID=UPI000E34747E|nr:L,D-transpeptidase family protein [Desertimonas flava]
MLQPRHRQRERLTRTIVVGCTVFGIGGIALVAAARGDNSPAAAGGAEAPATVAAPTTAAPTTTVAAAAGIAAPGAAGEAVPDLAIAEPSTELTPDCQVEPKSIGYNATGIDVQCLQQALVREGFYNGEVSGTFDYATAQAVEAFQTEHDLFVDGVVGRVTGLTLGIWPDEQLFVEHTDPLPAGTMDSWGYPVSSVTSITSNAPPLPEDSGSGYRVVYERISQRVWAVDENEVVIRSWLVSGSQYNNELPGTHQVYSRSEQSTAWNGRAILPYMIRWLKTEIGAIGFHGIPTHVEDGSAYQTEEELGTRLSSGCQRQANPDAAFLWAFADVGTPVVVI